MPSLIDVRNVSFTYNEKTPFEKKALENVTVTVGEGEIVGIIGPTGSGKTTLLYIMDGLLFPQEGEVLLFGKKLSPKAPYLKDLRKRVGIVFQFSENQFFEKTVRDEVGFALRLRGEPKEVVDRKVKTALSLVGLDPDAFLDRSPFSLSGGEKRRVAIASVLVMEPEVLILDEVEAGLDPSSRRRILSLVLSLFRRKKVKSLVFVSHMLEDIAEIADKVYVLSSGRVAFEGTAEEVLSRVESLRKLGLDVPMWTRIAFRVAKRMGIEAPTDIARFKGAVGFLARALLLRSDRLPST